MAGSGANRRELPFGRENHRRGTHPLEGVRCAVAGSFLRQFPRALYSDFGCEVRPSLDLGRLKLLLQFSRPLARMLIGLSSAFAYFPSCESVLKRTEGESSWERNSKSLTCNCSWFFFRSRHLCENSRSFQRVARLRATTKTVENLPRSTREARHFVVFLK